MKIIGLQLLLNQIYASIVGKVEVWMNHFLKETETLVTP